MDECSDLEKASDNVLDDQIATKLSQSKFTRIVEDDGIDFTAIRNMIISLSEPSESERVAQEKQRYLHRYCDQRSLIALQHLLHKLNAKKDLMPESDRLLFNGKQFFASIYTH
jgi:hypothetical protein